MKGIILAGGAGTRLYPLTKVLSKQILPIYDKPMIYYPLAVLMLAGIREILVISTPRDTEVFRQLLGDGRQLGMTLDYAVQYEPKGIAEAFLIAEEFIGDEHVALILGDNIFYGYELEEILARVSKRKEGATVFGYHVPNPEDFGVVTFDDNHRVQSIEEKPKKPRSNYAVPGLYFYDEQVVAFAKTIKPSKRGELEITAINEMYLKAGQLYIEVIEKGIAWLDTGTHKSLIRAAHFVEAVQSTEGIYIGCIEEIAYLKGYITKQQLYELARTTTMAEYQEHLLKYIKKDKVELFLQRSIENEEVVLKPITTEDLECMRMWRNSMNNEYIFRDTTYITRQDQMAWYEKYQMDPTDQMYIIIDQGQCVGTVALYHIDRDQKEAEFGRLLIGDLNARGKKLGMKASKLLCQYAFETLKLERIVLEVFEDNLYAKNIYEQLGFKVIGELEEGHRSLLKMALCIER